MHELRNLVAILKIKFIKLWWELSNGMSTLDKIISLDILKLKKIHDDYPSCSVYITEFQNKLGLELVKF